MTEYEQMEIDVRLDSERDLKENVSTVVKFLYDKQNLEAGNTISKIRNKHEGYGVAAEAYAKIAAREKGIKNAMNMYLGGLQTDGDDCIKTVSLLYANVVDMACSTISMAADMHRILNDMYYDVDLRTPLEKAIEEAKGDMDDDGFEEVHEDEEETVEESYDPEDEESDENEEEDE